MKNIELSNSSARIYIDSDEVEMFDTEPALQKLVSDRKVSLLPPELWFEPEDKSTIDILKGYFSDVDFMSDDSEQETMTVYRIGEIPYDEDSFFVTPDYKTWLKFYPSEEIHKITTNKLYLPLRNKSFSSFDELRNKYEKGEFTEDDVAYINPEESGIQHFEQYEIKPDDIIDLEQIDLEEGTCGYDTDVKTIKN